MKNKLADFLGMIAVRSLVISLLFFLLLAFSFHSVIDTVKDTLVDLRSSF